MPRLITCVCQECGESFTYEYYIGRVRRYCSDKCQLARKRRQDHESLIRTGKLKPSGISSDELATLMRPAAHPARGSVMIDEHCDYKGETRRCTYRVDDEGCITILCRYNPGPYCFHHAEKLSAEAAAAYAADAEMRVDAQRAGRSLRVVHNLRDKRAS